jgi:hypothetical protein
MKEQSKTLGYGNRGKTKSVFPPFPQPLLLAEENEKNKAVNPKQKPIVYTKYLTLPE